MAVAVNTVGYSLHMYAREVTKQKGWAHLEIHRLVFADLETQVQQGVLRMDPFGPSLVDGAAL